MTLPRILLLMSVAALVSGCFMAPCGKLTGCPAPSPGYRQVEGLAPDEQNAILARMPLEQRLDVYHDVYIRSGHPRTMLTQAFEGTGERGFEAVLARMTDERSFIEHFWIVHWMSVTDEIDVCEPRYFGPLSEKSRQFNTIDPKHPVPIEFGRCELIL